MKTLKKFLNEIRIRHVVTHSPSTYEYYSHLAGKEPKLEGIFKYTDAEDRDEAKEKAEKHAMEMNK